MMKTRGSIGSTFWGVLGVVLLSGCTKAMTGTLTPEGYTHGKYAMAIDNSAGESLLPEGWRLDSAYEKHGKLKAKNTPDYETKFSFDTDGDDKIDTNRTELIYDLRYVHKVHSGVIWIRTVPISNELREKELRVLMQDYVDEVAGAGYEVVNIGQARLMVEKRYAAEILRRGRGEVGGEAAYGASFAVANIDQVQVDKDARRERVMVVISRPGFEYDVGPHSGSKGASYPVLFIAGYSSLPDDFDAGLQDFQALLQRVRFDGSAGYAMNWEGSDEDSEDETESAVAEAGQEPTDGAVVGEADGTAEAEGASQGETGQDVAAAEEAPVEATGEAPTPAAQ